MNRRIRRPVALFVATACGLAAATAQAAIGARVLVQQWSPLAPDSQSVRVQLDQPSLVSDSLLAAWPRVRVSLCQAIVAQLGVPGVAGGATLRDIQCNLDRNITSLTVRQKDTNSIIAMLTLPSNSITATSTQSTACGRECDPRFSVSASALLTLGISVQSNPNQPLVVTRASLSFSNASIDSHNFAADIAKFVDNTLVPFFRGASFQSVATRAIDSAQFNFPGQFNSALASVNSQLRGPAQYVRVGLWARGNRITVAFAPPEITPPTNGSMSGVVRWDPKHVTSTNQSGPPNCQDIQLVSTVQTGPAPLLDPDDYSDTGTAPKRQVGSFIATAMDVACSYTLSGIAATWPNQVAGTIRNGNLSGLVNFGYSLKPDGWKDPVVPTPGAPGHNYLVYERFGGVATQVETTDRLRHPGDPVMDVRRSGDPVIVTDRGTSPNPVVNTPNVLTNPAATGRFPTRGPVVQPVNPGMVFPHSSSSGPALQDAHFGGVAPQPLNAPPSTLTPR